MFGEEFERVKFFFGVDGLFFSLVIDNCLGGRFIDFNIIYNFKYTIFLKIFLNFLKLIKKNYFVFLI